VDTRYYEVSDHKGANQRHKAGYAVVLCKDLHHY
jgi:hypothetical protein